MPDSDLQLQKPDSCPKCHAGYVRRILYGRPTAESFQMIQRGEAVLGGCFIKPWLPDWRCGSCRQEWFVATDPAKQEIELLLKKLITDMEARKTAKSAA